MNERQRLHDDDDYIKFSKLKNSIDEVQRRMPDGMTDKEIARCLMISVKHVKLLFESAMKKIKKKIKGA